MHSLTHSLGRIVPILKEVKRVAPEHNWCVAGGAVRDLLLFNEPRDYDVFAYLQIPPTSEIVDALVMKFRAAGYTQANRKSLSSYAFSSIEMWGVAVDLIVVKAANPVAVARAFDFDVCFASAWLRHHTDTGPKTCGCSCHSTGAKHVIACCGYEESTLMLEVWHDNDMLNNIRKGEGALHLMRDTTPDSTLRRGYNFAHRFGMKFKKEDQLHLAKLFLEKNGFEVKP